MDCSALFQPSVQQRWLDAIDCFIKSHFNGLPDGWAILSLWILMWLKHKMKTLCHNIASLADHNLKMIEREHTQTNGCFRMSKAVIARGTIRGKYRTVLNDKKTCHLSKLLLLHVKDSSQDDSYIRPMKWNLLTGTSSSRFFALIFWMDESTHCIYYIVLIHCVTSLVRARIAKAGYIILNFRSLPVNYQSFGNFQVFYGMLSHDI